MAGMADQDHLPARGMVAHGLGVHLGDQRTGGVEIDHAAPPRLFVHGPGRAVGRDDDRPILRRVGDILDEHGSEPLEALHHVAVVHNLVTDEHRRTVLGQRLFDDLDGPVDAGAEATRAGQQELERRAKGHRSVHAHSLPRRPLPACCKLGLGA